MNKRGARMQRIVLLWCTFLSIQSLYPMNPCKQIVPARSALSRDFLDGMPDDALISIIVYSLDRHNQGNISRAQRIFSVISDIVSLRLVSKKMARLINHQTVALILRELNFAIRILNSPSSRMTPLCLAARTHNAGYAHIILGYYSTTLQRCNAVNTPIARQQNQTPMLMAAQGSNVPITRLLLPYANLAHTDSLGRTSLMLAARSGNWRIMQLLLGAGADPTQQDNENHTVRAYAQTERTGRTLDYYETLSAVLSQLPRTLIALIYAYYLEPIPMRPARMVARSKL